LSQVLLKNMVQLEFKKYLLNEDSTAKDLAHVIHDELGKGFLFAIDVRTKRRLGAEHKLKNNDVVKIVSATSRK
jgi:ribosome-interacting GTPase 1